MINPLRRRNRDRGLTPEQRDEVQKLVFELVQTRLIHAFGPRGLFTVTPHDPTAVDTFFAQAVADTIAWDVAAKLATPGAVAAPIDQVSAALSVAVTAVAGSEPTSPIVDVVPPATVDAEFETTTTAEVATEASVSVDTAGVATVVTSRFAPPVESSSASQVAEARAQAGGTSADQQPESARRQLVA